MEYTWTNFPNIGFISTKLDGQQMYPIVSEVYAMQKSMKDNTPFNYGLAGNIEHQFQIKKSYNHIEKIVFEMANCYFKEYGGLYKFTPVNRILKARMETIWVNFQKKHEFNPMHSHSGDFSFVLFVDIPYELKDEKNVKFLEKTSDHEKFPGEFVFQYTNTLGSIMSHRAEIDKNGVGTMFFFDARMMHQVYPFYTSDDYRITISGNLSIQWS